MSSAYRELSNALFGAAQWTPVVEVAREGRERLAARLGTRAPVVRTLARTEGLGLANLQRDAEAAAVFRQMLADMPPVAERDHAQRVDGMSAQVELANLTLRQGDFGGARREASLALTTPMLPNRETPFLHVWGASRALIQADVLTGNTGAAVARASDILARGKKEYGDAHPYIGTFYSLSGVSELAHGRATAAVAAHRAAQAVFEAKLKPNHPRRLQTLLELAVALHASGDADAARTLLAQARQQFGGAALAPREKERIAFVEAEFDRVTAKSAADRHAAAATQAAAAFRALNTENAEARAAWVVGMTLPRDG
jgi:hypothetical protein